MALIGIMHTMKIAILGYGLEGEAALNYFKNPNNMFTVCDQDENIIKLNGIDYRLGKDYLVKLDQYDLIIRTAGLNPKLIFNRNPNLDKSKVTSSTNLFLKNSPTKNVIGVTGTKGKGTTATLIHKMLIEAGKNSYLAGNIGVPAISLLKNKLNPEDYVVLEMSSFQLSDCNYSPHISVCLLITQDHLDWHGQIEDYIASKRNIVSHQSKDDKVIYLATNQRSKSLAESSPGLKIPYLQKPGAEIIDGQIVINDQVICSVNEVSLVGEHNLENICAAITCVWQISQDKSAIKKVITSFTGLKNRLEFVKEKDGVKYYNDSFASAPDACIAAIRSFKSPKVMIVGGFDRGLELEFLIDELITDNERGLIRKVLLIGASKERLAKEMTMKGFNNYQILEAKNMDAIVQSAKNLANDGDTVILSPGFASFDMFKNFEVRGQAFVEAVSRI
jgi:UDP-N-acetylmuramoylalanine--D-glutamate ligase